MIIIFLSAVIYVYVLTCRLDDKLFHKRNGIFIALLFMTINLLVLIIVYTYLTNNLKYSQNNLLTTLKTNIIL